MPTDHRSDARLVRIAELYRDGIICPGELWNQTADATEGQDLVAQLDALPQDMQDVFRQCYRDRFEHAERPNCDDPTYQAFERWCVRE